jgi:proteasome accessory factor B
MTGRMAKLDRVLELVHALSESPEGLTLDEMAERLCVNRRTAERMRDIIAVHFDVDDRVEDRRKRFFIRDSLRRIYTRPGPAEIAALQLEVETQQKAGHVDRAAPLASLLAKIRSAFDDREKRRIDPDLDALARLQRTTVTAGPVATVAPETITIVQAAILSGACIEFSYATEERPEPRWRCVIPYGLIHGALTYLLGKVPGRDGQPVYYRLDRMGQAKLSETLGCAPDDWDIDAWLAESFALWRGEKQEVVLGIPASSAPRARGWRFHPNQRVEELGDGSLKIRFTAGGMREIAEHLFTWSGELSIEQPQILIETMRERIAGAQTMLPTNVAEIVTTGSDVPTRER